MSAPPPSPARIAVGRLTPKERETLKEAYSDNWLVRNYGGIKREHCKWLGLQDMALLLWEDDAIERDNAQRIYSLLAEIGPIDEEDLP